MKQKIINILILLILFIGINLVLTNNSYATVAEGIMGTCNWEITDDYTLIIHSGSIEIDDWWDTFGYKNGIYKVTNSPWTWDDYCDQILKVEATEEINLIGDMKYMFTNFINCTSIDVSGFNTKEVISMSNMFDCCRKITNLDLGNFDTSNVEDMYCMFDYCNNLTTLNLNSFDTSNVIYMSGMFDNCNSITSLDLSNFNTSKVEDMSGMFNCCTKLVNINLSNFDTSNVWDIHGMFEDCISLVTLDLRSFNISNVYDSCRMFGFTEPNSNLKTIYVSNKWNASGIVDSKDMFINAINIIGSYGTTYDSNNLDKTYAYIDNINNIGYLSLGYDIYITNSNNTNNINSYALVTANNNTEVIFTPNLGYKISKIIDNDNEIEINSKEVYTYLLENILDDHNIEVKTAPIDYVIISGNNQEKTENKAEDLTIISDGLYELFIGLEINEIELVKDKDYIAKEGEDNSTIITLSKEYLDTLSTDDYEIKFKYSNGSEPIGNMKIVKENIVNNDTTNTNEVQNSNSGVTLYNGGDANNGQNISNSNSTSSITSKVVNTGDKVLQITIPIILIILILNYIQIKYQRIENHKKKPRIGKK